MLAKSRGASGIVLAAIFWSTQGWLVKSIPWSPASILGLRALFVSALLCVYRRRIRVINRRNVWFGALSVACTALLFVTANKFTTAANAVILQYAMPLFVLTFNWIRGRGRPDRRSVIAVAVILSGIVLCFANSIGGGRLAGDFLALCSAATYAVMFYMSQDAQEDSLQFIYQGMLLQIPAVLYIPFDPDFRLDWEILPLFAAAVLVLFLGYAFFSSGMRRGVSAIHAAILANVEPILSPLFAFLMLGECPGALTLLGMAIVLSAITVYNIACTSPRGSR